MTQHKTLAGIRYDVLYQHHYIEADGVGVANVWIPNAFVIASEAVGHIDRLTMTTIGAIAELVLERVRGVAR